MATSSPALSAVAKGNMAFATKLYKQLREAEGNIFFSPISIEVVLALASTGAGDKTAQQIKSALELPSKRADIESGFHDLMQSLKSTDNMTLEIANKIFGEKTFPIEAAFKTTAEKSFLSAAEELDFVNNPEGAREIINKWVEERTNSKIKNLIPPGLIDPLTMLVLANAVYFKGTWKHQFNADSTTPEPFYVTPSQTKEVQMMHIKKNFGYSEREDLKSQILVMPYVGEKMCMVIILPNEKDGLAELENKIDKVKIPEILKSVDNVEVEVSLPRFTLETTYDLNEHLKKLGMTDMFSPDKADFSGISGEKGLYVSKVMQKAHIEVNEQGSEAAAATGVSIRKRRAVLAYHIFEADHPFLMFVSSLDSGITLLVGRVSNPDEAPPYLIDHDEL